MTATPMSPSMNHFGTDTPCKSECSNVSPCFNIKKSTFENDRLNSPRSHQLQQGCMEFVRSASVCGSGVSSFLVDTLGRREQINAITSFIDGSNVYGSDSERAKKLRIEHDPAGRLRFFDTSEYPKPMLPFSEEQSDESVEMDCRRMIERETIEEARVSCFMAGDVRANEQIGLTATHTIFLRAHNRFAEELHKLNPHWPGDQVYLETRKIIGAIIQRITYNEWLPAILGADGMAKLGSYHGYDETVNPAIQNVFATAAFRFGHALIKPIIRRLDDNLQTDPVYGDVPLFKAFFNPFRLIKEGGVDPIIRGLTFTASKDRRIEENGPFNKDLLERLFQASDEIALDLGALNIQRGRDHGIPFYVEWRQHCKLSVPTTFDELRGIFDPDAIRKLRALYKQVYNFTHSKIKFVPLLTPASCFKLILPIFQ